ncbi:MAG: serine hydrolase [Bacteroidota bacterium]
MKACLLPLAVMWSFTLAPLLAQDPLYFPPTSGSDWAGTSPEELGWCTEELPAFYDFLDQTNTKAFIALQDGKIVLERYFDDFTQDSIWYWASAGKSLTALLVGVAQAEGLLSIDSATADYLGQGWTSLASERERAIRVFHQLTMTTGLDDQNFDCTDPECLIFREEPGARWAYHNAPYTLLTRVIEAASGQSINGFLTSRLKAITGMKGAYLNIGFNRIYFSDARSFARFGLLMLNGGRWADRTVLADSSYFRQMMEPSQMLNPAYGYLWWLHGSAYHRLPGLPFDLNGPISPGTPDDAYSAIGRDGQILSVVPSEGLVWIRMGEAPSDDGLVPTTFHTDIWEALEAVRCPTVSPLTETDAANWTVFPNPTTGPLTIRGKQLGEDLEIEVWNRQGQLRWRGTERGSFSIHGLAPGPYWLRLRSSTEERGFMIQKM